MAGLAGCARPTLQIINTALVCPYMYIKRRYIILLRSVLFVDLFVRLFVCLFLLVCLLVVCQPCLLFSCLFVCSGCSFSYTMFTRTRDVHLARRTFHGRQSHVFLQAEHDRAAPRWSRILPHRLWVVCSPSPSSTTSQN